MGRTPVAVLMALALLGATATASASPSALSGTFTVQFPKGHPASNAPCDPDTFCGVGVLVG
ncbi:MAG: hypothetical protein QOI43_1463, partial [Gaiellales bacterium]|nr:hypothetical protein [Gaiellales bacterium]